MLWIEKYRPKSLAGFVGQKSVVEQAKQWLSKFKSGKAMMFYGPSGTGKTLLAKLLAAEHQLELFEPSEQELKNVETLSKTIFSKPLWHKGRMILIDADSLTSRDRGAAGAISNLVKESPWPIILTVTDPWLPRLRPLHSYCHLVKFTKISTLSISSKLEQISKNEKINVENSALQKLSEISKGDLRAAITDLQLLTAGKKEIKERDLDSLGWRERESDIFSLLQHILRAKDLSHNREMIWSGDKDPDEIFLWIEQNLSAEFDQKDLPLAYEILAKANLLRSLVYKQQNWRFKGYMIDMMAGLSAPRKTSREGYVAYKPPLKMAMWGKRKAALENTAKKIGQYANCSSRIAKRDYLPFLKILSPDSISGIGLDSEEIEAIKN